MILHLLVTDNTNLVPPLVIIFRPSAHREKGTTCVLCDSRQSSVAEEENEGQCREIASYPTDSFPSTSFGPANTRASWYDYRDLSLSVCALVVTLFVERLQKHPLCGAGTSHLQFRPSLPSSLIIPGRPEVLKLCFKARPRDMSDPYKVLPPFFWC
jgi:hypothetical protein